MTNHAVIVGVNAYFDTRIEPLPHVPHAVDELVGALVSSGGFGHDHIIRLVDSEDGQDPQSLPIRYSTIASLLHPPDLQPDDFFLFYFIGHGQATLSGDRLMPIDTSLAFVEETSLPVGQIAQLVRRLPAARKLLVFDACRNIVPDAHDVGHGVGNEEPEGLITLYACKPDERAWVPRDEETGALKLPLLTEGFIRAVVDQECRTLKQMYEIVWRWVTDHSYGMRVFQTPDLSASGLDPDSTSFLAREIRRAAPIGEAGGVDARIREVHGELQELYTRTFPEHFPSYRVPLAAAEPLRRLVTQSGSYRRLAFEFLEEGADADLYTVAYMVRSRPDPILLEPIIEALGRQKYRGTTVWQALDAIATLIATGPLRERSRTEAALRSQLAAALNRAADEHPTLRGSPFSTSVVWGKALRICRMAGVEEAEALPPNALARLREVPA